MLLPSLQRYAAMTVVRPFIRLSGPGVSRPLTAAAALRLTPACAAAETLGPRCISFRIAPNSCRRQFSTSVALALRSTDQTSTDQADKLGTAETVDARASNAEAVKLNQRQRLKLAIKEYGATVIVFHTCISLFTLGVSYACVSSGLDVVGLMEKVGVGKSFLESKLATGASTFMVAYAVHKVFAPARMATTLAATPLIVRYLRRIGFIKRPPPKL